MFCSNVRHIPISLSLRFRVMTYKRVIVQMESGDDVVGQCLWLLLVVVDYIKYNLDWRVKQ
jgi:hypothetical protein